MPRDDYIRLFRWWLGQGYSLHILMDGGGGVLSGDHIEYKRPDGSDFTPSGNKFRVPAAAQEAVMKIATELVDEVQQQAQRGERFHMPHLRSESGRFVKWTEGRETDVVLPAAVVWELRREFEHSYRDERVEWAPPSLDVAKVDRGTRAQMRVEGVGRGNIVRADTPWSELLERRRDKLTADIRADRLASRHRRTEPAREAATERMSERMAERERVRADLAAARRREGR